MGKAVDFLTPVGRLVQGDCFVAQTKDMATGQDLIVKTGPNAGQKTQKFFIAVAFKKTDQAFSALRTTFEQVARASFPQLFPNGGQCIAPNFSWKIIDGDGVDDNGKLNSTKEGFAGCWILRLASSFAPKCFAAGHYAPHEQLTDPKSIPRGHYIRVSGNVSDNIPSNKPGLYVNLSLIEWSCIGDVIVSGPDAATVFGGMPGQASPAAGPQMTATANGVPYADWIKQGWTDAALIQGGYMLAAAPTPPAPPAPPTMIAPPSPPPTLPVVPHPTILSGPQMTATANGVPYADWIKQGWTDAALIQGGYMLAAAPTPPAPPAPPTMIAPPSPLAPPSFVPPGPPVAPIAAVGRRMLPPANGVSYEDYIKGGWNDALLIQNGYMAD